MTAPAPSPSKTALPATRSCGSRLPGAIPFPRANPIFSSPCGAIFDRLALGLAVADSAALHLGAVHDPRTAATIEMRQSCSFAASQFQARIEPVQSLALPFAARLSRPPTVGQPPMQQPIPRSRSPTGRSSKRRPNVGRSPPCPRALLSIIQTGYQGIDCLSTVCSHSNLWLFRRIMHLT